MAIRITALSGALDQTASTFGSYVVTIPNNEVCEIEMPLSAGHVLISSLSTQVHGLLWCRGSALIKYFSGTALDAVNTALTGTTGADGKTTCGVNANIFYIENRSGVENKITVTFLGCGKVTMGN
ncbi:hypothetical protein [Aeromonas phage ZPAH34]|uniref:hypothetical protein n=1 Tax=Aeromonas phage ZPAH34 TaxID=2924888 RepID=UPI00232941D2|nr:hypothetical protein PQD16_gp135 [Aeromonas phage ZPAH34]UOX39548.1 hypothetical protein [Aeromonas phage ZPAH34]